MFCFHCMNRRVVKIIHEFVYYTKGAGTASPPGFVLLNLLVLVGSSFLCFRLLIDLIGIVSLVVFWPLYCLSFLGFRLLIDPVGIFRLFLHTVSYIKFNMQLIIQTFVQFDLIQNLTSRFDECKLCFNCRIF